MADPDLATSARETLRPLALESCLRTLDVLLWRCNRLGPSSLEKLSSTWAEEVSMLEHLGLEVPEELVNQYSVLLVSWKLAGH